MSDQAEQHTAADGPEPDTTRKKAQARPWYVEVPIIIGLTLVICFVLQTFIGRVYVIPSESMEPTLHGCVGCTNDRIIVDKMVYNFTEPKAGEVVVFVGTESWNGNYVSTRSDNPVVRGLQNLGSYVGLVPPDENALVKRIIATEGQTVSCQAGDPGVMVDGVVTNHAFTLQELQPTQLPAINPEYGSANCGGAYFGPITVPEDSVWVMGDNRLNSADSRYHVGDQYQGTIPLDNIVGKVRLILLPLTRIGTVSSADILPTN